MTKQYTLSCTINEKQTQQWRGINLKQGNIFVQQIKLLYFVGADTDNLNGQRVQRGTVPYMLINFRYKYNLYIKIKYNNCKSKYRL